MAPDKIEVDKIETLAEAVSLIKVLIGELVTLRSRVTVLEEENSRLRKNSSNSSKPPSSDIVKPEGQRRQPGKRKSGAQPGHEGKSRVLFPAEMVNTVDERTLSECPSCHGSLEKQADEQSIIHQVAELRQQPLEITEYRRHSYWCESCQKRHYGDLPDGVDPLQICGPRLQALMAYMKGNFGASYAALQQFCSEVLFLPISLGALGKVIKRVSQALSVPYNELAQEVACAQKDRPPKIKKIGHLFAERSATLWKSAKVLPGNHARRELWDDKNYSTGYCQWRKYARSYDSRSLGLISAPFTALRA